MNCTNPLGLLLSGYLADYAFEPFMRTESPLQSVLSIVFKPGSGSGIAVMFFIVGIIGMLISITRLRKSVYRELDQD
jgi:Ni/Fe-hydrogenase subunit HybB-like protein